MYDPLTDISNLGTALRGDETWKAKQGSVEVNLTPELVKQYIGELASGVSQEEMDAAILVETDARVAADGDLADAIEAVETTVAGYADAILALQDDVTAIETTLDGLVIGENVQAHSTILDALAALNNTGGLLIQTGATSFARRTITGTANEVSVVDGDGVAGNPTLSLPATIALAGKTVTGLNASSVVYTPAGNLAADDVAEALGELDSEKAAIAGQIFTGAVQVPAGDAGNPGLRVGDADTGFFQSAAALSGTVDGVEEIRIKPGQIRIGDQSILLASSIIAGVKPGSSARISMWGETDAGFSLHKFSADAIGCIAQMRKSRGSIASPAYPNQNDVLGYLQFMQSDIAANRIVAQIHAQTIAAVPSVSDAEGRLIFSLSQPGGITATETVRMDYATGFSMYGANPVIDQNRHFQLRSYTIATLPSASPAGQMIQVSDLGGGAGLLVSDGTGWIRAQRGEQTVTSDANYTLTPLASAEEQKHTGTLTANRTVTLATTNGRPGNKFRISRSGTGNFPLLIGTGTPLAILTTNSWCEVTYDGAAWFLSGYGTQGRNIIVKTADYTALLNDINSVIQMNIVATANTFTIPADATTNFPIGTELFVTQINTGVTSIAAAGGVTLVKTDTLALRKRYSGVTLLKVAADSWAAFGDFAV